MKKVLAITCIVIFWLMLIGAPRAFQQSPIPPGDYATLTGRLTAVVLIIGFLFFSVRWYITLNGHTYKVNAQAWASILLWYSFAGILLGVMLARRLPIFGVICLAIWVFVAWACWRWRKKVRVTERELSPRTSIVPTS